MGSPKYQADGDPRTSGPGFGVTTHPTVIDEPLSWRTPRIVFVNSMSDISVGENRDCRRITAAHKQFTCARQLSRTEEIRSLRTSKVAA
jgi:protein gp37